MKAVWNGMVLAESESTIVVEGSHYFPPQDVRHEYMKPSETHTTCPWKGLANYYSIEVSGERNKDAAWFYPAPKNEASALKDYVAFWRGVEVSIG